MGADLKAFSRSKQCYFFCPLFGLLHIEIKNYITQESSHVIMLLNKYQHTNDTIKSDKDVNLNFSNFLNWSIEMCVKLKTV